MRLINTLQKASISFLLVLIIWGNIIRNTKDISEEEEITTDRDWIYTNSFKVYRSSYFRGQITSNFSISIEISLLMDRGEVQTLYTNNLTKSSRDSDELVSENIYIALPTAGVLKISVRGTHTGIFILGEYIIDLVVKVDPQRLTEILTPYAVGAVVGLFMSILWRPRSLWSYMASVRDGDIIEIVFTVLLSVMVFSPNYKIIIQLEPKEIMYRLSRYRYAPLWWVFLAVVVSTYFTLNKRAVQYFWSYPGGKTKMFYWRLVEMVKSVWSISIQSFVYYFTIVYFHLSAKIVTTDRLLQILTVLVSQGLVLVQYLIVLGLLFVHISNPEIRVLLVISLYLISDYVSVLPFRISNIADTSAIWWDSILLPITITASYALLKRNYLNAEVQS